MVTDVYIAGSGLASTLGLNLCAAIECLRHRDATLTHLEVAPGISWPYFGIPDPSRDWVGRAREIVRAVVAEAGGMDDRSAPMFLASSSVHIGAIEEQQLPLGDCQDFAERVADWLDWRGPVYWISTACTSSINALLAARRMLCSNINGTALVLGIELRNRLTCAGFGTMQLLDPVRPRPLGAQRAGLVLGEAVAALYLTTRKGLWNLRGGANVVDGSDVAGATQAATAAACRRALEYCKIQPHEVDLIKLHAAGSPTNDAIEIAGLREVFHSFPALISLKHQLGHTLGASGAAEIALLLGCIDNGIWLYPDYALDETLNAPFASHPPSNINYVLVNIFGFGGGHAAVVLERQSFNTQ